MSCSRDEPALDKELTRMSEPDRVSLAFIWDTDVAAFQPAHVHADDGASRRRPASSPRAAAAASGVERRPRPPTSTKPEAKTLNFYNWTDYIDRQHDPELPEGDRDQGHVRQLQLQRRAVREDVGRRHAATTSSCPTDATLVKMKHGNLLEPLDLSQIPNVDNLDPRFRNAAYDPGNQYSIPWQWGTTGIGFDKTKVGGDRHRLGRVQPARRSRASRRTSTKRATRSRWRCSRWRRTRTRTDDGDLDEAKDYLIDLKKKIKSITSDYQDPLKSGELLLAQAYSGDVFQIQADNANIEYVIPTSGAFSWVDSMAIPKGAPHPGNAETFMNYILEPKVGAALTNFVSYGSPNKAADAVHRQGDPRQPADLPAGRRARQAAVPEGHRRGRAEVLRPVDEVKTA